MSFLALLIELALIGVITWAITTYIAMQPVFKTIITVVAVIIAVLLACQAFGIGLPNPTVPKVH
jgi:hypothetical protein